MRLQLLLLFLLALAVPAFAQTSADDHAAHHPGAGASTPSSGMSGMATPAPAKPNGKASNGKTGARPMAGSTPTPSVGMGGGGGMAETMGKMMDDMGGAGEKPLYPSLMDVPKMTPAKRAEVEKAAHDRMRQSLARISSATVRLADASSRNDNATMEDATAGLREATAQFESGVAASRALEEGQNPQSVALQWFKREMNLLPPAGQEAHAPRGLASPRFHLIALAILASFSLAMIWMYFHKMQRASALLTSLASGSAPVTTAAPQAPSTPPVIVAPPQTSPPSGRWSGILRVVRIFEETPTVRTFRLMSPDGAPIPFTYLPGQFLTVTVNSDEESGKPVKRSYTIASAPTERDYLEITVKREDRPGVFHVSRYLHEHVGEGDDLSVAAPSGKFTFIGQESQSIVLVAGGVGITPMMSVIRYLTARGWPGEIFLLYTCRDPQSIIFRDELEYLQRRHRNLHIFITLSRPENSEWSGLKGRITKEFFLQSVPDIIARRVHICGPVPFMDEMQHILAELGVPKEQVKTEAFGGAAKGQPEPVVASVPLGEAAPVATAPADGVAAVAVTFAKSGKSAPLAPEQTVLEAAEDVGVNIEYSCRVGTCGTCIVKMLSGAVTMEVEDGLDPSDKAKNMILACQAKATGDVAVDA